MIFVVGHVRLWPLADCPIGDFSEDRMTALGESGHFTHRSIWAAVTAAIIMHISKTYWTPTLFIASDPVRYGTCPLRVNTFNADTAGILLASRTCRRRSSHSFLFLFANPFGCRLLYASIRPVCALTLCNIALENS